MSTTKTNPPSTALVPRDMPINGVEDLMKLADIFYKAGVCPRGCGRPEAVAAVILMGREVGLRPAQAMSSIMVATSKTGPARMSMWGDALLALVRGSGKLARIDERLEGEGDQRRAVCVVQRAGEPERTFTYSVEDAKKARLWTKEGPWQDNPNRQMTMRARAFALRDVFTDVLCGLVPAEEADDYADAPGPKVEVVRPPEKPAAEQPPSAGASALPGGSPPAQLPPPAPANGELMVGEETLKEIAKLREPYLFHTEVVAPQQRELFDAAWKRALAPYGVDSARKLTQAQAEDLHRKMQGF